MDALLFEKVVAFVSGLTDFDQLEFLFPISNGEKLKLYALFKQATVGPCSGPRPSFFDLQGKYKYDAWRELGEMSRMAAMNTYVEHVVDYIMSLHKTLCEVSSSTLPQAQRKLVDDLGVRIKELKHECAILWPQRFAHLRSPDPDELAEDIYEKEEVASFGERDDNSFGTPMIISEEIGLPLPGNIANLLNGHGKLINKLVDETESNSDDYEGEDDPLHVKEPRLTEASTDSLVRKSPMNTEFQEIVLASFKRLDALEDAVRKIQLRFELEDIKQKRKAAIRARLLKVFTFLGGGGIILYILFKLVIARRRRQ